MSILAVRRYAYAINEIFGMVPNADPDSISLPSQVLDELKKVKETLEEWEEADDCADTPDELSIIVTNLREERFKAQDRIKDLENEVIKLKDQFEAIEQSTEASAYNEQIIQDLREKVEEWEEADDYIDTPDELTILVSGLREEHDEAEDRIEELESELLDSRESFNLQDQSDNFYLHGVEYADEETNEPLTLKDVWELRADAYKSHRKIEELEECKDITMDDLTTAEKEGDETLEEYVKRRIDKYILEGSLFTSDELKEARRHAEDWEDSFNELKEENEKLTDLWNKLNETIQEAVPPS